MIRPVLGGVAFEGRIHFDNLSEEELGALLVAIDLRPDLRHRLGMVRPFGFGSVRITRRTVRIADPQARYRTFFSQPGSPPLPEAPALEAGFVPDSEARAHLAKATFARAMARHRGTPIPNDTGDEEAAECLWADPRMQELAALLEWKKPPDPESTQPVGVQNDPFAEQWRGRWILPPPHAVLDRDDPWQASTASHPRERGGTSRSTGPAARRPAGAEAPPERETWPGAMLSHHAGGGVLVASHGSRKAESRGRDATRLLESLPDEDRARLKVKQKPLKADVEVSRVGNAWRIEAIRAARPGR